MLLLFSVHEFLIIFIFITFRCIEQTERSCCHVFVMYHYLFIFEAHNLYLYVCVRCTFNSFIGGVQNFRVCAIFRALDCWMDEVHVVHSCWFRGQSPLHLWCTMIFCYCKVACVTVFLLLRGWTKMVNELLFSWLETLEIFLGKFS